MAHLRLSLVVLSINAILALDTSPGEAWEQRLISAPYLDIEKDLRLLYYGSQSDYFISTFKTDVSTAHEVCQNISTMSGKKFKLLVLENLEEVHELQLHLDNLNITGIWSAGEKSFNDEGTISLFWSTPSGKTSMQVKNFHDSSIIRKRRDVTEYSDEELSFGTSTSDSLSLLYPWLAIGVVGGEGRCRSGKFEPPCEPVQCNVTSPPCHTITPPCKIENDNNCEVTRLPCAAKCENCTVNPPICYAQPKPCTVKQEECQIVRPPCSLETFPCETVRPPCKVIQPVCEVITPEPCTTPPPSCIPTFEKDNCTTKTFPCRTNRRNETICPPPKTICKPAYKCELPVICQSPPIICPPPLIDCPPETTTCPPPVINCPKPVIYCPQPEVDCPEPEIVCTRPVVNCSAPVITCPGIISNCNAPSVECPPPTVYCPDPIVECTKPEPCIPPEIPTPPPCTPPTTTTSTTPKPCQGCGCVLMSQQHDFKWEIDSCSKDFHFICES